MKVTKWLSITSYLMEHACLSGYEMLCRNAGILGVITNGGFADYISAPEKNVFKIPDNVQWDVAASLATTTKTPYHAL